MSSSHGGLPWSSYAVFDRATLKSIAEEIRIFKEKLTTARELLLVRRLFFYKENFGSDDLVEFAGQYIGGRNGRNPGPNS